MTELEFAPTRGEGPVGTGVHLLRPGRGPDGATVADAWLTLLFLPVVPFGRWTVERSGASGSSWLVRHVDKPGLLRSVAWVGAGVLAALASLAPAYLAVTFFMGSKPAELGGLFASAGAILGTLGWLDETRDRVPLRVAVRALSSATGSPQRESAARRSDGQRG